MVAILAILAMMPGALAQQPEMPFHGARTGELAQLCSATAKDVPEAVSIAYCQGFFIAAGQYHQEMTAENGAQRPIFCLPTPSPTFDEARMSFVAWVRANPQYSTDRSIDGLLRFAAESYPCPAQPPSPQPSSPRRRR